MSHVLWPSRVALVLAATLVVALVVGGTSPGRAQEGQRAAPSEGKARAETRLVPQRQWEYEQLPCMPPALVTREGRNELADQLNERGKRGWELVSLIEIQPPGRECLLATFKRQRLN